MKPRKRSLRNALIAATIAAVFASVAVGAWVIHRASRSDASRVAQGPATDIRGLEDVDPHAGPPSAAGGRESRQDRADDVPTPAAVQDNVVPDDGSLLWASPTAGRPVNLQYVPTRRRFMLRTRPVELLAHEEGRRVLRALGPTFQRHLADWERQAGVRLSEIERLTLSWVPNQGQIPQLISVIGTAEPVEFSSANTHTHAGKTYVLVGDLAKYQPPDEDGRVTVVGAPGLVQEVIEQGAAPPILRREIGLLRQVSDDARQLTILFPPNFVYYDGRPLFGSRVGRLLSPLERLLGDGLHAGLLSFHLGDNYDFYGELRLIGRSDFEPAEATAQLVDSVGSSSRGHRKLCGSPSSGRLLAADRRSFRQDVSLLS